MIPVAATLAIGILVGYLSQRSRFCSIGGFRDFFLARDTYLLKGYLGILIGGVFGFIGFKLMGGEVGKLPMGMDLPSIVLLLAMIASAVGLGFFSVLAGGCPTRQHVKAAEGKGSAAFYLIGFYAGIVYFYLVTIKFVMLL